MLESSVNAAAEQSEESQVSEGSLNSLLRLTSAVAQSIDDATSHPDPAPSCGQPRMRETSRGEEEEELRKILQSVLVRSLDAVEDLAVPAVHVRVLHTILLPRLPSRECHHVIISCLIFTIPTLTPFHVTMKIAPIPAEITYP